MQLSILICHIVQRDEQLLRLLGGLMPQAGFEMPYICDVARTSAKDGEVIVRNPSMGIEIAISTDDATRMTIGQKRNRLLNVATGEWTCFIDDDDVVHDKFCPRILEALKESPDCVGIEGWLRRPGFPDERFIHSKRFATWFTEAGVHYRNPNHLNPVRRTLALEAGFPDDLNHGEDFAFSMKLLPLLKTEVMLEGDPVYFYYP